MSDPIFDFYRFIMASRTANKHTPRNIPSIHQVEGSIVNRATTAKTSIGNAISFNALRANFELVGRLSFSIYFDLHSQCWKTASAAYAAATIIVAGLFATAATSAAPVTPAAAAF
jgi:hypothetical protein